MTALFLCLLSLFLLSESLAAVPGLAPQVTTPGRGKAPAAPRANLFTPLGLGGGGGLFAPSFSPDNPEHILVACDMGGVYRSTDGGASWKLLHMGQKLKRTHQSPPPVYLGQRVYWVTSRNHITRSDDGGATWQARPKGPWFPEAITDFTVAPLPSSAAANRAKAAATPEQMLVATAKGLWIGNDQAWRQITEEPAGPVLALPAPHAAFYAVVNGTELRRSRDNGIAWETLATLPGKVAALAGAAEAPGTGGPAPGWEGSVLLASVEGTGLLRSVNGGKRWQTVKTPFANENCLRVPPGQTKVLYALQTSSVRTLQLLRSADGGLTWKSVFRLHKRGITPDLRYNVDPSWVQTQLNWGYVFPRQGLGVDPHNPDSVIVTTQGDLYFTRDGGKTWRTGMNRPLPPLEDGSPRQASTGLEVTSCWGYYFDPHDPQREYIAYTDVGFARSLDQGASWSWAAKGSRWPNTFYDVVLDPAVPGRLYAAASQRHDIPHYGELSRTAEGWRVHGGGVVVSDDWGATWKVPYAVGKPGGLPNQVCTTVVLDPASPPERRTLYAGIFGEGDNAGVYVSKDGGATWEQTKTQPGMLPNRHIYRLRLRPKTGNLYCLITGLRGATRDTFFRMPSGGVWMSADKGGTWTHLSAGSPLNRWATALTFDPADENVLYVTAATPQGGTGIGGLYKTPDHGKTWYHILKDTEIKRVAGEPGYDHCMAVAVNPHNSEMLLVGTALHGLLYSLDGGRIWWQYEEFPFPTAQNIVFHPRKKDRLYVTTFGAGVWTGPLPERRTP